MWLLFAVSLTSLPPSYMKAVRSESRRYGFDPLFVAAVIYQESRFNRKSCFRGSHGLMQIQLRPRSCHKTRKAAAALGLYRPRANIRRGLKLMAWWRGWWLRHHRDKGYHWLLHYNQGFGRCPGGGRRCSAKKRIPIRSGKIGSYADRVLKIYEELKKIYGPTYKDPSSSARHLLEGSCAPYSISS